MPTRWSFPPLPVRDLDGVERALPANLEGERNVVILAFQMRHQRLVDTWLPWLEEQSARDPGLRAYEVPTIGTGWRPLRGWIDGGMARAIPDPAARRRTLTAYVPVGPVTAQLGITDTTDIWLFVVDGAGTVHGHARGPRTPEAEAVLADALGAAAGGAVGGGLEDAAPAVRTFPFAFDGRYQGLLRLVGVTPENSTVVVTPERFVARFGRWVVDTPVRNVRSAEVTGPYRGYRAIGARASLADRGATFGSSTAGGVCVCFHEPVRGLDPTGLLRHPGLTVTVADGEGLVAHLRAAMARPAEAG